MNGNARCAIFRRWLLLFLICCSFVAALAADLREPLVVLVSGESGTKVELISAPGKSPELLTTFRGQDIQHNTGAYLGDEPHRAHADKGMLLLQDNDGNFLLDLKNGKVTRLKQLYPHSPGALSPDGRIFSTSPNVRASKDGRYALVPRFDNYQMGEEGASADVSFVLYDTRNKKSLWEKSFGQRDVGLLDIYAHFTQDRLLIFIDNTLYSLELKEDPKLIPITNGAYFMAVDPSGHYAVMMVAQDHYALFDLRSLKVLPSITIPASSGQFSFSGDGRCLSCQAPESAGELSAYSVWLIDTKSGKSKKINREPAWNPWPCFSPDGKYLYYIQSRIADFRNNRRVAIDDAVISYEISTGKSIKLGPALKDVEQLSWEASGENGYWLAITPIKNADGPLSFEESEKYPSKLYCLPWGSKSFELWDTRTGPYEWIIP